MAEGIASTAAGALGPRLAGRLTAETILRSPQYMSCIGLYHLDLRGAQLSQKLQPRGLAGPACLHRQLVEVSEPHHDALHSGIVCYMYITL